MNMYGVVEVQLLTFLISAEVSSKLHAPDGSWVGPKTSVNTKAKKKSFVSAENRNPVVQPVVSHYTDRVVIVLCGCETRVLAPKEKKR
jgi:hypothetical protein